MAENTITVLIDGEYVTKEVIRRQNGFDSNTGEPIMETVVQDGFDPMTGEPVYTAVERTEFNPETGEPVYSLVGNHEADADGGSDAVTYANTDTNNYTSTDTGVYAAKDSAKSAKPKGKLGIIIGAVVGAVALASVIFLVAQAAIGGPQLTVVSAINKTIKDDSFGNTLMALGEIAQSDAVTAEYKVSAKHVDVEGTSILNVSKGQFSSDVDFDVYGIEQKVQAYYDENKVQVAVPDLLSKSVVYDCTGKNDGLIAEIVESETQGDIDDINTLISGTSRLLQQSTKYKKAFEKELLAVSKEMKIEKLSAENFEVDGKDRKCKGYQITIDKHLVKALKTATKNAQEKVYGEEVRKILKACENLTGEEIDTDDLFDQAIDAMDDMGAVDVEVFIYGGKIAAIRSSDLNKLKIEFRGGDTRTSEIVAKMSGVTLLKKKSSISSKVEKGTITIMDEDIDYSYNMSSGKLEIEGIEDINAVLLVKGKSATIGFELDKPNVEASIVLSKGGKVQEIKGDAFNIGEADQDDLEDFFEDAYDELKDSDLGGLLSFGGSRAASAMEAPAAVTEDWD